MLELNKIYLGDCLEKMKDIADKSIDAIITDPPYQTTSCKWDIKIPFEPMWEQLNRIIKPNGAIVLFGSEPFSSALRMSNIKKRRHEWYWNKNNSAGFATAKIRPFSIIENILVFCNQKANYYPQMETRGKPRYKGGYSKSDNYGVVPSKSKSNEYYPKNLINISNSVQIGKVHPTQKPVALIEYLIKTYTLENETILDFTIGSGTTAVACVNTKRNFIGIEKDDKYFEIANKRIEEAKRKQQERLF